MSTVSSDFLDRIEQEIADNTLPPLPGSAPTAPQPNEPSHDGDSFEDMRVALVAYLTALSSVAGMFSAIIAHHPDQEGHINAFMLPLLKNADALVSNGETMQVYVTEFVQSMMTSPQPSDPDSPQPPDDPHDEVAWAQFMGQPQGGDTTQQ